MKKDKNLILFGERIKEIRGALAISQQDFAKSIDVAISSLSEFEAGKTKPTFYFFFNISKVHNVNLRYLLHGEGEMFKRELEPEIKEMIDDLELPSIRVMLLAEHSRLKTIFKPLMDGSNKERDKNNNDAGDKI